MIFFGPNICLGLGDFHWRQGVKPFQVEDLRLKHCQVAKPELRHGTAQPQLGSLLNTVDSESNAQTFNFTHFPENICQPLYKKHKNTITD